MQPLLEFCGIGKSYGKKPVLRDLTLAIYPGEIVGFLGLNGAGKTTALSIAAGLLHCTAGAGKLFGLPLANPSARRRLGYLPDNPAFFRQSSKAAVRFAATLQGMPRLDLQTRALRALASVSMPDTAADARKLSRGQQQRLAIAQAFVSGPDLLMLDEPTFALDPSAVYELRDLLLAARAAGKGIFFSSHQLSEVERICDRILFLRDGQIVRQGALEEVVLQSETFVLTVRGLPIESPCWLEWRLAVQPDPRSGGLARVEITAADQRKWIEKLWAAGGELVEVGPKRQSLEGLFLTAQEDRPGGAVIQQPGTDRERAT